MAETKARVTFNVQLAKDVAFSKVEAGVRAATIEGKNLTTDVILGPSPKRTGRKYPRGKKKNGAQKYHTASSPGESPAPDFGILRAATSTEFAKTENGVASGKVVNNEEYAAPLQLGTEKMAARPWISRLLTPEFAPRLFKVFADRAKAQRPPRK